MSATAEAWSTCYPRLRAGLGRDGAEQVRRLVTAAWSFTVDGRAFLEDLAGAASRPGLPQMLKLHLLELLWKVELLLAGSSAVDQEHLLPLSLELGFTELASISGAEAVALFGLTEPLGTDDVDTSHLTAFWDALVEQFPGALPNPLTPTGQREIIRALRKRLQQFLQPLLQSV